MTEDMTEEQNERFMLAFGRAYDGLLEGVKDHAKLRRDLGMDSLDLIEVLVEIEKEFDITLDDLEHARTISDLKKLTLTAINDQNETNEK